MTTLVNGLIETMRIEEALVVQEAQRSALDRYFPNTVTINHITCLAGLSVIYGKLDRVEEALTIHRDLYSKYVALYGPAAETTIREVVNVLIALLNLQRYDAVKAFALEQIPVARRHLGPDHFQTLKLRLTYSQALFYDKSCSIEDMIESHTILKDVDRRWRRVLGPTHPDVQMVEVAISTVGNAIACARRRSRVGT